MRSIHSLEVKLGREPTPMNLIPPSTGMQSLIAHMFEFPHLHQIINWGD